MLTSVVKLRWYPVGLWKSDNRTHIGSGYVKALEIFLKFLFLVFFCSRLLPIKIGELYVGGLETPFGLMKMTKAVSGLSGKIVECKYVKNQRGGSWAFLRERTDKSFPNAYNTAKGKHVIILSWMKRTYSCNRFDLNTFKINFSCCSKHCTSCDTRNPLGFYCSTSLCETLAYIKTSTFRKF